MGARKLARLAGCCSTAAVGLRRLVDEAAAEAVRELCRRRAAKALSFSERRMLETARGLVVQEIADSRAQVGTHVLQEIEAIFS